MAYDDKGNYVSTKDIGAGDWQKCAYENLANAIVARACDDYLFLGKHKSGIVINSRVNKDEILKFLNSQWFYELTNVDSEYIINTLDRMIANGYVPKWVRNKEEDDEDA